MVHRGGAPAHPFRPALLLAMIITLLGIAGCLASLPPLWAAGSGDEGERRDGEESPEGYELDSRVASDGDTCGCDLDVWWPAIPGIPGLDAWQQYPRAAQCPAGCSPHSAEQLGSQQWSGGSAALQDGESTLGLGNSTPQLQQSVYFRLDGERACWLQVKEVCQPRYGTLALPPQEEFLMNGSPQEAVGVEYNDTAEVPLGGQGHGVTGALDKLSVQNFLQQQEQKKVDNVTVEKGVEGRGDDSESGKVDMEGTMDHDEVGELVNFVAASNGGKVIQANPEMSKAQKAIDGSADTFLKTDCAADSWLVLELSQVARVKVLEVTMKEMYSSRVSHFEVLGRDSHPGKDADDCPAKLLGASWQSLGKFTAENKKGCQQFRVNQPMWVRYLGIHLLSYYGSESVCAINEIKVFGVSAAQDIEAQLMKLDTGGNSPSSGTEMAPVGVENDTDVVALPSAENGNRGPGGSDAEELVVEGTGEGGSDINNGEVINPGSSLLTSVDDGGSLTSGNGGVVVNNATSDVEGQIMEVAPQANAQPATEPAAPSATSSKEAQTPVEEGQPEALPSPPGKAPTEPPPQRPPVTEFAPPPAQQAVASQQPAVRAYEKIRQDIQALKSNSSMLWTYVDQLQSVLQETISGMDHSLASLTHSNATLWVYLVQVQDSLKLVSDLVNNKASSQEMVAVTSDVRQLELQVRLLQSELRAAQRQPKVVMGALNLAASCAAAFALRSRFFGRSASALAAIAAMLAATNAAVGALNIAVGSSAAADAALRAGAGCAWDALDWMRRCLVGAGG